MGENTIFAFFSFIAIEDSQESILHFCVQLGAFTQECLNIYVHVSIYIYILSNREISQVFDSSFFILEAVETL